MYFIVIIKLKYYVLYARLDLLLFILSYCIPSYIIIFLGLTGYTLFDTLLQFIRTTRSNEHMNIN